MPSPKPVSSLRFAPRFLWSNIAQYFLRGILVIAPLFITISALYWIFRKLDGLFHPYINTPGLGVLLLLLFVVLIGWVSSFFFIKRTFRLVDHGLVHTPGVSFIYSSVRDFFEAFVGRKRRFTHAVLVNALADEVWLVGFLTDEGLDNFNLGKEYVSVYVPQAYNVAGQLYILKRERVRPIENLSPSAIMKYAVTGGAVEVAEKDA